MAVPKRAFSVGGGPLRNPCSFSIPFRSLQQRIWWIRRSSSFQLHKNYKWNPALRISPVFFSPWWQRRGRPCLPLASDRSWTWAHQPAGGPSPRLCPRPGGTGRCQSTTRSIGQQEAAVYTSRFLGDKTWRPRPSAVSTCFPLSESMMAGCVWALTV